MLSVASETNNYLLIIPEMVHDFERMITWWYADEARYTNWIPQTDDIFGDNVCNYTQSIVDIFAESKAISDGEMRVDGELPDSLWEMLMMEIGDNFDWWYPRMMRDIWTYLDNHHFFYDAFEYAGNEQAAGDYRNSPLQEVW